jgi:hypothetical protein
MNGQATHRHDISGPGATDLSCMPSDVSLDLTRRNAPQPKGAAKGQQRPVFRAAVIDLQAQRDHALQNRLRRLHVIDPSLDTPNVVTGNIDASRDCDSAILMPRNSPVRIRVLIKVEHPNRSHPLSDKTLRKFTQSAFHGNQSCDCFRNSERSLARTLTEREFLQISEVRNLVARNHVFDDGNPMLDEGGCIHQCPVALPISSVIFLASPSSIMVLSR